MCRLVSCLVKHAWRIVGVGFASTARALPSLLPTLRPLCPNWTTDSLLPVDQKTKTASGSVIPEAAAEKPDQGEILAVGPGKRDDKGAQIALDVKVGDRVLFGKYAGQTVKVDGNELLVMREEDIMAVVQK